MCLIKKPKVVSQPTTTADKEPPILRNPYLDGLDPIIRARRGGVSGLTIRRGQPSPLPTTPTLPAPPNSGGGNAGGGSPDYPGLTDRPSPIGAATKSLLMKVK